MESALTLTGVSKHYDGFDLQNVNLTLPQGCIMGFIGENGAGKSTTMKLILDLISMDAGKITLLGQDSRTGGKMVREQIGVVMDECCFPEILNAIDVGKMLSNVYATWDAARYQKYLEDFSLPLKKKIKEYSRGMKMKLSIACALSHASKLLLLDEATSGLDPVVRDEILDVFLEFMLDETHSILLSSHIVSDLEKICDYITFIRQGRIIFSKSKDSLLEEYGILKCSVGQFRTIDSNLVLGKRENAFGVEALVERKKFSRDYTIDRASIEDIMVFYGRENG